MHAGEGSRGGQHAARRAWRRGWTWITPGCGSSTHITAPPSVRLPLSSAGNTEPAACAACQSGLLDSCPPHATCTRSQPSSMLPLSLATKLLRWRFLASSLVVTYGLLTSSHQHSATCTPRWTSRSAHRTPSRLAQTAPAPGLSPSWTTMALVSPPYSVKTSPTPRLSGARTDDPSKTR